MIRITIGFRKVSNAMDFPANSLKKGRIKAVIPTAKTNANKHMITDSVRN